MTLEAITPPTKEMKAMRLLDCMLIATEKLCFYAGFTLFFKSLVQMYQGWGILHGEREHPQATRFAYHKDTIHRCDGCDGCERVCSRFALLKSEGNCTGHLMHLMSCQSVSCMSCLLPTLAAISKRGISKPHRKT